MARGGVLPTTNASNTRDLMHRGWICDIVLRLSSHHSASIVLVDPVQLRFGVTGDITGHRHALTHGHNLLLCWHKHPQGLWKETSRQDHLPKIHSNKPVDNQHEQTKHMKLHGGAALSYLVNGRAGVLPVVWLGHRFNDQLAAVWVKLVVGRVNGGWPAGRKSFVDSMFSHNTSSTLPEDFCIQFIARYFNTQQKSMGKSQWRCSKDATGAAGVRTYTFQVMFGFGIPSTKHSSETLVSGLARTFFSSSFRYTVGGTASLSLKCIYLEKGVILLGHFAQLILKKKLTIDHHRDVECVKNRPIFDLSLTAVHPSILSFHLLNDQCVIRQLPQMASNWWKKQ